MKAENLKLYSDSGIINDKITDAYDHVADYAEIGVNRTERGFEVDTNVRGGTDELSAIATAATQSHVIYTQAVDLNLDGREDSTLGTHRGEVDEILDLSTELTDESVFDYANTFEDYMSNPDGRLALDSSGSIRANVSDRNGSSYELINDIESFVVKSFNLGGRLGLVDGEFRSEP